MEAVAAKVEAAINHAFVEAVAWGLERMYPADEGSQAGADGGVSQRTYARFYVLETIARVPYFSFLSALHLWETVGWWRQADYLKVHFAQTFNELHHLLIMEALGGNDKYVDRFFAQHAAVFYYMYCLVVYLFSPRMAYNFQEQVEEHAFATYDNFLKTHGDALRELPAPSPARAYYTYGDLYLFHEFQTETEVPDFRRPRVETLYDTFVAVRDDEAEHMKTMAACQTADGIRSPHSEAMRSSACDVIPDGDGGSECHDAFDSIGTGSMSNQCRGLLDCVINSPTGKVAKPGGDSSD